MDWNAIYPGPEEPTAEQLSAYVSHPLWEPLNRWICEAYSLSPIYSYSSCSMGRGWNVKYRSGGKALCTLYPAAGAFTCLVVAPAQASIPRPAGRRSSPWAPGGGCPWRWTPRRLWKTSRPC